MSFFGAKPGGLSLNTGSANTFGASGTGQPQQSSSLFGSTPSNQTGGLFGQTSNTSGGGLFGQSTSTQNKPATGGLFGNQPTGGGLFGSTTPSNQQNMGSIFGQSQNQSQAQQQQGIGLLGSVNAQNRPSLFTSSINTAQPLAQSQRPSLFAPRATHVPIPPSFANSLQYSSSMTPAQFVQSLVPGVKIDLSNIKGTTRFNDLSDELQAELEKIDDMIQLQINNKNQCEVFMAKVSKVVEEIPTDNEYLTYKVEEMHHALENDAASIDNVRSLMKGDVEDAQNIFRAVDVLRFPQRYQNQGLWNHPSADTADVAGTRLPPEAEEPSVELVAYFNKQLENMSKNIEEYKKILTNVEGHLKGREQAMAYEAQQIAINGGHRSAENSVQQLTRTFEQMEEAIIRVAGKVATCREDIDNVTQQNRMF